MSTSTNLDTKILLKYITTSLHNWGNLQITQQHFKLAKKNEESCAVKMTKLLFDLCILHMLNYEKTIEQLGITFCKQDTEQIKNLILAHLYEISCPLLVVQKRENSQDEIVGFDFSSSRLLLIACGWVMAVSRFFNQGIQKLFKKNFAAIYKAKPLNLNALSKKGGISLKETNLYQNSTNIDRISFLSKALRSRKYSIQCLIQKKNKILNKIRETLAEIGGSLQIEDVLSSPNNQQVESKQNELRQMIGFEMKNMGYRKYWWIWLDQVIISSEYKQLAGCFQTFEKVQRPQQLINYRVQIDLKYPIRYIQTCANYRERIEAIFEKMQQMQMKPKKNFKEIDRQIHDEIAQLKRKALEQDACIPSFIGMQIKKYMDFDQKNSQPENKPSKQPIDKISKILKQKIKKFIRDIEEITFI